MKKQSLILAAAVAATLSSSAAMADLSVNVSATNNYLWRGVTQSADTASVAGGIDWSHDSGIYAGMWTGSLVVGQETDLYAGYAGEAGSLSYDVGFITYAYFLTPTSNFSEVYFNGAVDNFSFGVATTTSSANGNAGGPFDKGDMYLSAGVDFEAGPFDANVTLGTYMFDNDPAGASDYVHYDLTLSKGDVSLGFIKNDLTGGGAGGPQNDSLRIVATWSKSWDL